MDKRHYVVANRDMPYYLFRYSRHTTKKEAFQRAKIVYKESCSMPHHWVVIDLWEKGILVKRYSFTGKVFNLLYTHKEIK